MPSTEQCLEIRTPLEVEANTIPIQSRRQSIIGEESGGDGVFLTWEDLWVTVSKGKKGGRCVLEGVSGYAQPGELLAIMGPSGCGKSTLLDALAGRLSSNTRQDGDILINGHKQTLAYGTSAYVTQEDTLMTTLTVREAVCYSAQLQLPEWMSKAEKKERAEVTIREMGLQDAMNTRIGGWRVKGISGGQKRRVSICIEMLTRPRLLFLDEPTSGLDSAASYYVMNRISKLDQQDGIRRTIVASIHQPSNEVFQLFTNLCLLSSGKVVYFGPASAANEFFALNGFPCPTLQNPSDHFLKTINRDFDKDLEQGQSDAITAEEAIGILTMSYKSSDNYQQVKAKVTEICHNKGFAALEKGHTRASFFTHCQVLTRRSSVNMSRDFGYYWLRLAIYVAVAAGLATVFSNLGTSYGSIQDRGSLIMFVASFLTFMTIGGFPSFVEDMKIFERERLNGHYTTSAFIIANTLSAIPYLILISVIPGAIAYYLSGLHKGHDHFVYFALVLFACMMLIESLMMAVASVVPNYLMGIITGAGIQGLMILGGGFFRLPNNLPHIFWKYPMYYVTFHRYAYQGLFKNEFEGLKFDGQDGLGHSTVSGDDILRDKWHVDMNYSKWVDLGILLGMIAAYRLLFLIITKITENRKPVFSRLLSTPPKPRILIMETPMTTPSHGETINM